MRPDFDLVFIFKWQCALIIISRDLCGLFERKQKLCQFFCNFLAITFLYMIVAGELYKLKMLTSKIMDYCMKYLIEKDEEEKLECLCKLLTTIGEQVENEVHGQLDNIFKKMQDIVDRKSNKISSRVRLVSAKITPIHSINHIHMRFDHIP